MKIKLIVGLGNPGKCYENTRHNMGFMVLDDIVKKLELGEWKKRDDALFIDCHIGSEKVILLKPQKYMNLSGDVLIDFVRFYDIKTDDIIVICDDLDLPIGTIKLKLKGSSGGHNGLKNIENQLKTNEYKRIKIGISNNKSIDTKDYVLGKVIGEEAEILKSSIEMASEAAVSSLKHPFEELMSKYNVRIQQN